MSKAASSGVSSPDRVALVTNELAFIRGAVEVLGPFGGYVAVTPFARFGDPVAVAFRFSVFGPVFQFVSQAALEEIDCFAHVVSGDVRSYELAVDVKGHVHDRWSVAGGVSRLRQLHAGGQDRLGDLLGHSTEAQHGISGRVRGDIAGGDDLQLEGALARGDRHCLPWRCGRADPLFGDPTMFDPAPDLDSVMRGRLVLPAHQHGAVLATVHRVFVDAEQGTGLQVALQMRLARQRLPAGVVPGVRAVQQHRLVQVF